MIAAARKGLDKVLEGLNPDHVEEQRRVNVDNMLPTLNLLFQQIVEQFTDVEDALENVIPYILSNNKTISSPQEINAFFSAVFGDPDNQDKLKTYLPGLYASGLIQQSYNHGYNNFQLTTRDMQSPWGIGFGLKGSPESPLLLTVDGPAGHVFGGRSVYVHYKFMSILGVFIADGVKDCSYILQDRIPKAHEKCSGCTFKTSRQDLLDHYKNLVNQLTFHDDPFPNTLWYIHPDGGEQQIDLEH